MPEIWGGGTETAIKSDCKISPGGLTESLTDSSVMVWTQNKPALFPFPSIVFAAHGSGGKLKFHGTMDCDWGGGWGAEKEKEERN